MPRRRVIEEHALSLGHCAFDGRGFLNEMLFGGRNMWASHSRGLLTDEELVLALSDRLWSALDPSEKEVTSTEIWRAMEEKLRNVLFHPKL